MKTLYIIRPSKVKVSKQTNDLRLTKKGMLRIEKLCGLLGSDSVEVIFSSPEGSGFTHAQFMAAMLKAEIAPTAFLKSYDTSKTGVDSKKDAIQLVLKEPTISLTGLESFAHYADRSVQFIRQDAFAGYSSIAVLADRLLFSWCVAYFTGKDWTAVYREATKPDAFSIRFGENGFEWTRIWKGQQNKLYLKPPSTN